MQVRALRSAVFVGSVISIAFTLLSCQALVADESESPVGAAALALTQSTIGPSTACHVTDGSFTTCSDARTEWSDVTPQVFPETNAFLYADQADLDPTIGTPTSPVDTFMLMYDECGRRTPLGPDEYFLVSLSTVEIENDVEHLNMYNDHLFSDGTIVFIENGVPQHTPDGSTRVTEIEGQRGRVAFGQSPNCPFDHVIVEFQIKLSDALPTVHGGYSPDPQFWSSTPPCTVTISGGAATMNVGERTDFTATVSGGGTPLSFQWLVDGNIVKDYSETTNVPYSTTPMAAADFKQQTLAFFWKPDPSQRHPNNAGPLPRKVQVDVTAGSTTCHAERTINVERNSTNIDRQAEDFYTSNHSNGVLQEHVLWHSTFRFATNTQGGALFFDFHHEYIGRFNSWRAEFGYPAIDRWDPATPLPTGPDVNHVNRPGTTSAAVHAKPSFFTIAGGSIGRPSNGLPCEGKFGGGTGQTKLVDFPANRDLLGCAVESPWHNSVHGALGGDMGGVATAPKDPIFWQWHNFVDVIGEERKTLTPPTIEYQSPFRLFRFISALPSVSVTFSEFVTGVRAADLTVNGSPATSVVGSGAGPYVFTGYSPPALGDVSIVIGAGTIVDVNNEPFAGRSWSHTLLDPAQDSDGDGLMDGQEANVTLTDPTTPDTDGDGLPDAYEVQHACLNAIFDEAHPHDDDDHALPPQDDPDHDGLTNLEEFQRGSDPCVRTFVAGRNAMRAGFDTSSLPANDDGSTGLVSVGFPANFFGTTFNALFVNNNGNVTFDAPLGTFTPFDLRSTGRSIIAPFFGDVDTRTGSVVTYGAGNVDGHRAFGVTWPGVGCFNLNTRVRNFFQVVLVERSDAGVGGFDIEFNYDSIQWETGQASGGNANCAGGASARVGFSNGSGQPGTSFEFAGSGVPGSFLDSNLVTGLIHHSLNSLRSGRYVIAVRNGIPNTKPDADDDNIPDELDNCPGSPNSDQADRDLNGIGDACESPALLHDTAAFLQANANATTTIEATGVAVSSEPSLLDRVVRIVKFRVDSGLTGDPNALTRNLVDGLVSAGLIRPEDAESFVNAVIQQLILQVTVDIKPGTTPNSVNPRSNGVIPVAILSTATFNTETVDASSVRFGPGGASEVHGRGHVEDVNRDGRPDLVLHFATSTAGIVCGQTSATLIGRTSNGQSIRGVDGIVTVGCH